MFDGTLVKLIKFPAEHLTIFHGTLVFRGTPVENHCCRLMLKGKVKKALKFVDNANDINGKHDITTDKEKLKDKHPNVAELKQSAIIAKT